MSSRSGTVKLHHQMADLQEALHLSPTSESIGTLIHDENSCRCGRLETGPKLVLYLGLVPSGQDHLVLELRLDKYDEECRIRHSAEVNGKTLGKSEDDQTLMLANHERLR